MEIAVEPNGTNGSFRVDAGRSAMTMMGAKPPA